MTMPVLEAFRGLQFDSDLQIRNADGSAATSVYTINSVLAATVWEGQSQAILFSPTVSWYTAGSTQTGYDQGQVALSIQGGLTLNLNPAGEYYLLITVTTSGVTSPVIEARLKILATPGTTAPAPPDLATYDYVLAYLTLQNLSNSQLDFLPYLISAASNSIRRWCFDRNFDLRTYCQIYPIALDGSVRLYQVPVNQVTRVQSQPQLALTVSNTSSSVQVAQVYFSYTGQAGGYGTNAQVPTGITLASSSSGVASTTNLFFSANQTITNLAGLITAVGGGWTATADTVLGLWPVTELVGGYVGQAAGQNASPSNGAAFPVLTDLNACQLQDQQTGFLWVGRQYAGLGPRWGPGWDSWDWGGQNQGLGQVKVTYSAGFTTIPPDVQECVAEYCRDQLLWMRINPYLESETADEYSYRLRTMAPQGLSPTIMQRLSPYRLHYA